MSPQQEPGTATRCLSDKRFWPQEEVETLRDLGVTLLPGHQEGRYCGLLPAWVTSSQVLREETRRGAARAQDNWEMSPSQAPIPFLINSRVP